MVLYVLNEERSDSTEEFVQVKSSDGKSMLMEIYKKYQKSSVELRNSELHVISPSECRLLYVTQREMAVTGPSDETVDYFGAEDATTCHLVVIRQKETGVTLMTHVDNVDVKGNVDQMVKKIRDVTDHFGGYTKAWRFDLYLVGGFLDKKKYSQCLSQSLLEEFHKNKLVDLDLKICCISQLNDVIYEGIHWPKIYGICVNIKTGQVFPAKFPEKGPDLPVRHARHSTGGHELLDIYDYKRGRMVIGPFEYNTIYGCETIIQLPDSWIRQNMSTSPEVEPSYFEQNVRDALEFTIENPDSEVYFSSGPKQYCMNKDNQWISVS